MLTRTHPRRPVESALYATRAGAEAALHTYVTACWSEQFDRYVPGEDTPHRPTLALPDDRAEAVAAHFTHVSDESYTLTAQRVWA